MQRQAVRNRFIGSLETVYANRHVCSMQIHVYSSKLRLPAFNQHVTCRCRNMFQYMVTDGPEPKADIIVEITLCELSKYSFSHFAKVIRV